MEKSLLVYEHDWLIEMVYEVSDKIRGNLVDQTLFEERCFNRLGGYLEEDANNIKNRRYINRMIHEVASSVVERNKNEFSQVFSDMASDDEEGSKIEYEPADVLANVESELMQKETADLLAQDDCRNKKIIEYWTIGNTNGAHISRSLARAFGGNVESHRKYYQRFRQSCRASLSAAS